jgi:hypothetical protein
MEEGLESLKGRACPDVRSGGRRRDYSPYEKIRKPYFGILRQHLFIENLIYLRLNK